MWSSVFDEVTLGTVHSEESLDDFGTGRPCAWETDN